MNVYPIIPTDFIARQLSKDRWQKITKAVQKKYGTTKLFIAYHNRGPVVHVGNHTGKQIGTLAEVEKWANKK